MRSKRDVTQHIFPNIKPCWNIKHALEHGGYTSTPSEIEMAQITLQEPPNDPSSIKPRNIGLTFLDCTLRNEEDLQHQLAQIRTVLCPYAPAYTLGLMEAIGENMMPEHLRHLDIVAYEANSPTAPFGKNENGSRTLYVVRRDIQLQKPRRLAFISISWKWRGPWVFVTEH